VVVGLCLERSLEMVVGVLGILKAGGAYLPLDPTYPAERLAFMLHDARATVLVTRQELVRVLPAFGGAVISLDTRPETAEDPEIPRAETTADHVAYLMYTSGSTGRPKAVAVPHRGVTRLVMNTNYVKISASDIIAQVSNVSFDAATFEVWGALLNGAQLAVVAQETVLSPTAFSAELERRGVTILFLTTALFHHMARQDPGAFRRLRAVLFGGESAEPRWVAEVLKHGPPERLLNMYGPTEATTFACWYPVTGVPEGATGVPIGRPISNTRIYLLDRHLIPVPIGVPGMLYVGGPGVARGYVRRPELDAERFIPDPFGAHPGRLYRTGDAARYLPDGNIEFIGRMDQQVKIRGHRIEPGEIEAVLRQHPAVREVLVLAREDAVGDKRLSAYVVPAQTSATGDLRCFLKDRLPGYMIPAHIVVLDAFPLTPNGKIDRAKLPLPEDALPARSTAYAAPMTPLEHQLVQIWEECLQVRPIGIRDDFFELGGHSLLAVRLMSAIEEAVGRKLPLSTLFAGATVQHLAQALLQHPSATPWGPVTAIHPDGSRPPFFFLHGDLHGGGFYCRNLARALGPQQPFMALHPHGLDGRPVPISIEAMAADRLATVRSIQPHGPYRLGGYCNGGLVAFEMARLLRAQGESVDLLALLDPPTENAWAGAGLLRGLVERLGAVRGLTPEERFRTFVLARRPFVGVGRWAGYYRRRLRTLSGSHLDDWIAALRRVGGRTWKKVAGRSYRGGRSVSTLDASRPQTPVYDDRAQSTHERLDGAYHRAIAGYVPQRYVGEVTLLYSSGGWSGGRIRPWRAVACKVRTRVLPGEHLTCITRYVAVLGEELSACLRTAPK
ncbi:MAG TPA: amino acid adenylation domain-containing protein, partial [bacterium]|nr:amino acid adenylation domain-containing protein [bacterium]